MKLIINLSDTQCSSEMRCDLIARGLVKRGHQTIYGAVGRKRKESYSELPHVVMPLAIEVIP